MIHRGSHGDIGLSIGHSYRHELINLAEKCLGSLPEKHSYQDIKYFVDESTRCVSKYLPKIFEELVGISESTSIPMNILMLMSCEELWDLDNAQKNPNKCTDLIASKTATVDGFTYLAHTNDLNPDCNSHLTRIVARNEVPFLCFTNDGYFISWACNENGLVFSGNTLTSDDIKPGIPRLLLLREAVTKSRPLEAMGVLLSSSRCSSYNNILIDKNGSSFLVEASATEAVPLSLENDIFVHTNHFKDLTHHEMNPAYLSSFYRLKAGNRLLSDNHGHIDANSLALIISDHGFDGKDGICRHSEDVKTIFSTIVCPESHRLWYSFGSPCEARWESINYY